MSPCRFAYRLDEAQSNTTYQPMTAPQFEKSTKSTAVAPRPVIKLRTSENFVFVEFGCPLPSFMSIPCVLSASCGVDLSAEFKVLNLTFFAPLRHDKLAKLLQNELVTKQEPSS